MAPPLTILLQHALGREQIERLRAISPTLRLLTREEVRAEPGLLAEVAILYGHLGDEDWPRARALRWVQIPWVGADDVLTPAFRARGVPVYKSAGVNARCMVESMFAMVLAHNRRLPAMWEAQRRREWIADELFERQRSLEGRTLGLLGVGTIGGYAADVGRAFQMRVIGCRASGEPHPKVDAMFGPQTRLDFFRRADVILNTLPLTDWTRRFVGREELAATRPGTILVNVGRGATVDTAAMIESLHAGHLGAAMLDVYDEEPLPPGDALWTTPHVYISPHCSGHYPGRWERSDEMFIDNVARFVKGEPLLNPVDLAKGY